MIAWLFNNAANVEAVAEIVLALAATVATVFMVALRKTTPSRSDVATAIASVADPLRKEIAEVKKVATEALARAGIIESALDRHATKDDVSEILRALERQDGDRRALGSEVKGMREGFVRIEQQLDMLMQEALRR